MIALDVLETEWGWLGLASSERGLCGLTLPVKTRAAAMEEITGSFPGGKPGEHENIDDAKNQLTRYFHGDRLAFTVRLDLPSRPLFWSRVWTVVSAIPYGSTRSYGEVARQAGADRAARAVGGAMAHNLVPIIVPCHRVVGSAGGLTGFGGGLEMKRKLLEMEAAHEMAGAIHH